MPDIKKLREQRAAIANEVRDLVKNHPEGEDWTPAHQETYNKGVANIEAIDAQIERHQKVIDLAASNEAGIITAASAQGISVDEATHNASMAKGVLNSWLRGGVENLTPEQREFVKKRNSQFDNAMSTGTGSEGGFTTQREFAPMLIEALAAYGGMRNVATIIQSDTGSPMDFPTANAATEEGEIVGENVEVDDEDPAFGALALATYKFSSKAVAVPFELLTDTQIDLEGYINGLLSTRIGRITNRLYTVGTGTNQPHGLLQGITAGKVGANGSTTTTSYDDLVDLQHSVDPAYRASAKCGFMFHDQTLRDLKKLKDLNGLPIWLPGLATKEPNTLLDSPYTINQSMPVMAANAHSIAFGDFSKYVIRDVNSVQLFRFTDSVYTLKGQVGFLAFFRSGGRNMDVGGAVKTYQNSAA